MLCQTCGNETPDQGLFCLACGTRVNKECPRCAEIIKIKAKACRYCGHEFTPNEMAQIEKDEQERQRQQKQQAEQELREQQERERENQEKAQKKDEVELQKKLTQEEFRRFHPPDLASGWGFMLLKCPKCSTLNSVYLENCRLCSASLKSAPKVKNPYL